jgi:hypothetical protein
MQYSTTQRHRKIIHLQILCTCVTLNQPTNSSVQNSLSLPFSSPIVWASLALYVLGSTRLLAIITYQPLTLHHIHVDSRPEVLTGTVYIETPHKVTQLLKRLTTLDARNLASHPDGKIEDTSRTLLVGWSCVTLVLLLHHAWTEFVLS